MREFRFVCRRRGRLDIFLREALPQAVSGGELSNSKIRRLIVAGAVRVNAAQIRRPAFELERGSAVTVLFDGAKFFYEKRPDDVRFEVCDRDVLFEDEHLIAVNKPTRFPSEKTPAGGEARDSLHQAVIRRLWRENPSLRNPPYAGIVHRLDRDTSGVMIFAKTRAAAAAAHAVFERRLAQKVYRAVSVCLREGERVPREFSADDFIGRISPKSAAAKWGSLAESAGGRHAHTDFTVIGAAETGDARDFARDGAPPFSARPASCGAVLKIEARPLTGRTHQIRVHLAGLGLPVLGDTLYGAPPYSRMMLHAQRLTLPHPVTGQALTLEAPLPDGF